MEKFSKNNIPERNIDPDKGDDMNGILRGLLIGAFLLFQAQQADASLTFPITRTPDGNQDVSLGRYSLIRNKRVSIGTVADLVKRAQEDLNNRNVRGVEYYEIGQITLHNCNNTPGRAAQNQKGETGTVLLYDSSTGQYYLPNGTPLYTGEEVEVPNDIPDFQDDACSPTYTYKFNKDVPGDFEVVIVTAQWLDENGYLPYNSKGEYIFGDNYTFEPNGEKKPDSFMANLELKLHGTGVVLISLGSKKEEQCISSAVSFGPDHFLCGDEKIVHFQKPLKITLSDESVAVIIDTSDCHSLRGSQEQLHEQLEVYLLVNKDGKEERRYLGVTPDLPDGGRTCVQQTTEFQYTSGGPGEKISGLVLRHVTCKNGSTDNQESLSGAGVVRTLCPPN